ncbi:ATP-binding protein [uncultured Parabacteroides sp.]|jgi:hypothetical protein|uniref:AlbA family DNA-binding domain-containing protein n=1 Tax=uncultured Parabacteroides sp. TaxID=512312 RepID=UPI0026003225|nr:ATP-binding protein [uncultured Parabacteroides sp.]
MENTTKSFFLHEALQADMMTEVDFDKTTHFIFHTCGIDKSCFSSKSNSYYPASNLLLKETVLLYKNRDLQWVEVLARFEEKQAKCLIEDGQNPENAFLKAFKICRWMSEESDYLQVTYMDQAEEKRNELFLWMDDLLCQQEMSRIASQGKTEAFLESMLNRLRVSGHLWHEEEICRKVLCLLSFDPELFDRRLSLVIDTVCALTKYELIKECEKADLQELLMERCAVYEKQVEELWFANDWHKIHPILVKAIQMDTLAYLLLLDSEDSESDIPVISARICRYLSRIPSPYSSLLKNKSYTLLTGEITLEERIDWEYLSDFDENKFLERIVLYCHNDEMCVDTELENRWKQYSNTTNTLTLDNEGFTLSPLFPSVHSWRGRKDKASILNNRLFVASFSKLPCAFDSCKSIKDFRLYWKQLEEDFPMSVSTDRIPVAVKEVSFVEEEESVVPARKASCLEPEMRVTVRVLYVDRDTQCLQTEIIDEEFRGKKACLPFSYINSCYYMIPGFADLYTVNEIFRAKVKQTDYGEIKLSLLQDYNEFIYPECVRQKFLLARVIDVSDGMVRWLLSTGATASIKQSVHNKYAIGDYYKIGYAGLDPGKLKNQIKIQSRVSAVDEDTFNREILDNYHDFFSFLTKEVQRRYDVEAQKANNNPFVIALKNLSFNDVATEVANEAKEPEEKTDPISVMEVKEADDFSINSKLVRELIYCIDSLVWEVEDVSEQFNAYNMLWLLCRFAGDQSLAEYYRLCADYIYNVDNLATCPFQCRFSRENIVKFDELFLRMNKLGIQKYGHTFVFCQSVIGILDALLLSDPLSVLRSYMEDPNPIVSELARYFSITIFLKESDVVLQELAYRSINHLLGFNDHEKRKKSYVPVCFGHEGVEKEFKTSAFIHADKNAMEEQSVVLARVIASFMNTDGGTLYIGVDDGGYLVGLTQELKYCHYDSDVYLRTVNRQVIRLLGEKDDWNRYQEYVRCRLYEYEDGRQVLAFRVPPINEVVKVKGAVYTRSASSNMLKPVQNVSDFIRNRREMKLDSTPLKPEFPTFFSQERNEYIFPKAQVVEPGVQQKPETDMPGLETVPETLALAELVPDKKPSQSGKFHWNIQTSVMRCNPLQKKAEQGYTPKHVFYSLFADGKIACSLSPKIGVWGREKGKVLFSCNPDDKEEILVSVWLTGEVGISNLKKMSQYNTPLSFVDTIDPLFFIAPARRNDYLLLISEKDGEKRYRVILVDELGKSMGVQPKNTLILEPDKGTFIFAEILTSEHIGLLNEEKTRLDDFDQYNGGRYWEHSQHRPNVGVICKLCNLPF